MQSTAKLNYEYRARLRPKISMNGKLVSKKLVYDIDNCDADDVLKGESHFFLVRKEQPILTRSGVDLA